MPTDTDSHWKIAVSKKATRGDTIWQLASSRTFCITDGTHPEFLDEPIEHYTLDIDTAVTDGVHLLRDKSAYPLLFPRIGTTQKLPMTALQLAHLQDYLFRRRFIRQDFKLILPDV